MSANRPTSKGVQPPATPREKAIGCLALVIVGGIALGLIGYFTSRGDDVEINAYVACQQFVEDRLKAPGSADFSAEPETEIVHAGNRWRVRGYVDAENSFGAKIRSNFTCVLRYRPNAKRWEPVAVTVR